MPGQPPPTSLRSLLQSLQCAGAVLRGRPGPAPPSGDIPRAELHTHRPYQSV